MNSRTAFHRWWGTLRTRITWSDDRGVAMVTAMMVLMVLTALGATVAVLATNNLRNASRDRQAGSALGAADAGVAQAIDYLRVNGVGGLNCLESAASGCSSLPAGWSNPTNPQLLPLDNAGTGCSAGGKNCARVWIGIVQQFNPPSVKVGTYRIHSQGVYGTGPGARNIAEDVAVGPDKFPIGVFGQTLSGNGGTAVYTESLFTTQCVSPRQTGNGNGTRFSGIDQYWGQPAAAHTTLHVSTANNCGSNGYIASVGNPCPNNAALNYDQTGDGGTVSSGACYRNYTRPDGTYYPDGICPSGVAATQSDGLCDTTAFTTADLQRYGYRPRGLSDAQYAALKSRAQSQGTYNIGTGTISSALTSLANSGVSDPVLYWDCSVSAAGCSGGLSLKQNDFPSGGLFQTGPTAAGQTCPSPFRILTIVVEHADLTFQGGNNQWIDAALFVPDGSFNGNGGYNVLGTLFARNLDMGGNQTWQLDSCWTTNFPGAILSVTTKSFREDDTKDVS